MTRHAALATPGTPRSAPSTGRIIGIAIGAALFAAALVMLWGRRDAVFAALDSIPNLPAHRLALWGGLLIGSVLANITLSGVMFSILMSPRASRDDGPAQGRVRWWEMQALIAASTLLNYVPLRPGLFGRVAYHRAYNDIPVSRSITAIVQAVALSGVGAAMLLGAALMSSLLEVPAWMAAGIPLLAWLGLIFTRHAMLALAGAVRYVDLLFTAVRYVAAFSLLGLPIDGRAAMGFACISALASMIPVFGSGLGVREWAVGLCSPILTVNQVTLGLTADLLNRAAEIVVVTVTGLIGLAILARLRARRCATPHRDRTR